MIDLNGIIVKNRFFVSSGALAFGNKYLWAKPFIDTTIFGAVVTRTLTLEQRQGNFGVSPVKPDRILEQILWGVQIIKERPTVLRKIPGEWINRMGWWNIGIDRYISEIYPKTKEVPIIVSIGGFSIKEYIEMIRKLNELEILAVEINVSCPNVEIDWETWRNLRFESLVKRCREESKHPLIVKLSAKGDYIDRAYIAQDVGINAVSAINTIKGLIVEPKTGEFFYGGVSGKRIKEIALRVVSEIRKEVDIPIIGGGGIYNWKDCQQFFWTGVNAVSFGSIFFFQPWKPTWIVRMHQKEAENEKLCGMF